MNLTIDQLSPQFLKVEHVAGHEFLVHVSSIAEADGIRFLCPKCFKENNGEVGTHMIMAFKPGVDVAQNGNNRWEMDGTGYQDVTLSPSIFLLNSCGWHGFVTMGHIDNCG